MIEPSLLEKPLSSPSSLSRLKKAQILADRVVKVFPFAFLVFSTMALAVAGLYMYQAYDSLVNNWPSPSASLNSSLLCFLVVAGGMLLCLAGWRFPVLRLTGWQILLIILGASLGLYFSSQHVSYQTTCCQVAYLIGRGYPFTALRFSFAPNTALPYSWDQINELIGHHSDQITQDIAWHAVITNSLFYANTVLIPVVLLGCMLRIFGVLVRRKKAHATSRRA